MRGELISRSTKEGRARKKACEGAVFGNPDILTLQPAATAAASEKTLRLREAIANVLEERGGLAHGLTNSRLAEWLNSRGLRSGQNKLFTNRTVAGPKQGAEEILKERLERGSGGEEKEEEFVPPPNWGRF